jgi:hypothetical protein
VRASADELFKQGIEVRDHIQAEYSDKLANREIEPIGLITGVMMVATTLMYVDQGFNRAKARDKLSDLMDALYDGIDDLNADGKFTSTLADGFETMKREQRRLGRNLTTEEARAIIMRIAEKHGLTHAKEFVEKMTDETLRKASRGQFT